MFHVHERHLRFSVLLFWACLQANYRCICEAGWEASAGNPACVTDVNECELPNQPCSSNPAVPCYNTQGSFYCGACPAGNSSFTAFIYSDNTDDVMKKKHIITHSCLMKCLDTKVQLFIRGGEIVKQNKPSICGSVSMETSSCSFGCTCEYYYQSINVHSNDVSGWHGNGYSCQDVDECLSSNGGCSTSPMVQCLNTMGSFHCGPCPPGKPAHLLSSALHHITSPHLILSDLLGRI